MNLLGAKLYDPSTAATKATTALLAMTAFDTTNLRLTVTVPAHGFLFCRMRCAIEGATTYPQILLGLLNGASVVARVTPSAVQNGTALATTRLGVTAEFVIPGLAPGSITLDAAYGVEILLAATNIKYGGPNNTVTDDAWGAFVFEIWDPQPLPIAAPGAAAGLPIIGTGTNNFQSDASAHVTFANTSIATVTTVTGQLTAAQIATGVWGDTTAGDFTVSASIGKSVLNGVALGTGLTINGYTGDTPQTGDSFARLGAPAGASVSADIAAIKSQQNGIAVTVAFNLDTNVGSRMATYTQPTGFLAATFPATVASPTNITAGTLTTVTNLTNAPTAGDLTATMKTSVTTAATAATPTAAAVTGNVGGNVVGSVGSVVAGVTLAASAIQAIWDALTSALTTAGSIGKLLVTNIDALISSRTKPADTQAAVTLVTTTTNLTNAPTAGDFTATMKTSLNAATPASISGAVGSVTGNVGGNLVGNVNGNVVGSVASVTNPVTVGTLPSIPTNWITAAGIAAAALNGKGDWLLALSYTAPLDAAGTRSAIGLASANLDTQLATIDADVLTRLPTSSYVAPDNADIASILSTVNTNLDAKVSTRLASASISLSGGQVTVGTNNDKLGYSLSNSQTFSTTGSVGSVVGGVTGIVSGFTDPALAEIVAAVGAAALPPPIIK